MMKMRITIQGKGRVKRALPFYLFTCLLFLLAGCKEELASAVTDSDGREAVMFTTYMPEKGVTRTTASDAFDTEIAKYRKVEADYQFTIKMFQKNVTDPISTGTYQPIKTETVENEGQDNETTTVSYDNDGTLQPTSSTTALYWPNRTNEYGFEATAGNTGDIATDQSTEEAFIEQDYLRGYGFVPEWDATNDKPKWGNVNTLNYLTMLKWKEANEGIGLSSAEQYKKIPLYLTHQRSLITIKLKAGEGVDREDLVFEKAKNNVQTYIYGYNDTGELKIKALAGESTVVYGDETAPAVNTETIEFSAIVEPYNYSTKSSTDVIAEIKLSNQRYTFYASNDSHFEDNKQSYNLEAGKHLTITATLGRESRKIVITAYVEDWTETVTTSIVDDYGQAGDPILITSRDRLLSFLQNEEENKQGNVAIIVPNSIDLEKNDAKEEATWTPQPLKCTLNMAGATFTTTHPVFSTIASSGSLVNGNIFVGNTTVTSAIATSNEGTLERITVVPRDADGVSSTGKASVAGLVQTNYGTIVSCYSELPVYGTSGFVGGIAARSIYRAAGDGVTMPVIDGCTVDASVNGAAGTKGGGIVGEAVGRVTNNTFEHGITILQNATNFKNIIQTKADDTRALRAYDNAWPTKASNVSTTEEGTNIPVTNINKNTILYSAVVSNQDELAVLLTSTYNNTDSIYRLSDDFAVTKTGTAGWNYGIKTDELGAAGDGHSHGNIFFKLDGNNKTITTNAMLFSNIQNDIYDLTIRLSADLEPAEGTEQVAVAPLGYSVYGTKSHHVKISNIQVKAGTYKIKAPTTVGGVVVWAYGEGNGSDSKEDACAYTTIENCQAKATLVVNVESIEDESDAQFYSGGIVANAEQATITRCVFHNTSETLYWEQDAEHTDKHFFFGGILGGTAQPKGSNSEPCVLITDCTSWLSTRTTPSTRNPQRGAIVGYSAYADGTNLANGLAEGCQGNWWNTGSDAVGTLPTGKTTEQVIGKCNAVKPTQDNTYDPTN